MSPPRSLVINSSPEREKEEEEVEEPLGKRPRVEEVEVEEHMAKRPRAEDVEVEEANAVIPEELEVGGPDENGGAELLGIDVLTPGGVSSDWDDVNSDINLEGVRWDSDASSVEDDAWSEGELDEDQDQQVQGAVGQEPMEDQLDEDGEQVQGVQGQEADEDEGMKAGGVTEEEFNNSELAKPAVSSLEELEEDDECLLYYEDLAPTGLVNRALTRMKCGCRTLMHRVCILGWLKKKNQCPKKCWAAPV